MGLLDRTVEPVHGINVSVSPGLEFALFIAAILPLRRILWNGTALAVVFPSLLHQFVFLHHQRFSFLRKLLALLRWHRIGQLRDFRNLRREDARPQSRAEYQHRVATKSTPRYPGPFEYPR